MFSYYTIDKTDSNNKTRNQKNLSGYPMSAENNVMYKAEVEYILWGNPSGKNGLCKSGRSAAAFRRLKSRQGFSRRHVKLSLIKKFLFFFL